MDAKAVSVGLVLGLVVGVFFGFQLVDYNYDKLFNEATELRDLINVLKLEKNVLTDKVANFTNQVNAWVVERTSLQLQISNLQIENKQKGSEIIDLKQQIESIRNQVSTDFYPTYTPEMILSDYNINSVNADVKYKYHTFFVKGLVEKIATPSGYPRVTIVSNIECEFEKAQLSIISDLRAGQEVIILGNCQGQFLTIVELKGCSFYKIFP